MTAPEVFTELVYDLDARPFIEQTWPQAEFEDASTWLREGRFSVRIPGITAADFYPPIMVEGWAGACLGFELSMRIPERHDEVYAWLAAAKALKAQHSPASDLHASVSPEQTPSVAADSAHSGDQCTVGETT